MNKKKRSAVFIVVIVTSGLLTLSAFFVPRMINKTIEASNIFPHQEDSKIMLASNEIPVLKVEPTIPVSTVSEYLEQTMTEIDLLQIYDLIDNSKKDGFQGNRELTEKEIERRLVLDDQYTYDGIRPKSLLPLKAGNYDFYFDLEEETFNYPKRSLTDEELLQYIDWYMRVNFALAKRQVPETPDAKDITKTEATDLARKSVKRLFDVDTSKLEVFTMYSTFGPGQKGIWNIHFQPYKAQTLRATGQAFLEYNIMVDPITGVVMDTTIVNISYKKTPISATASQQIKKDQRWIQAAKTIVTQKQGETRKITKATLVNDSASDKRGVVNVKIELDDGSFYTVELRYPDMSLRCLLYESGQ